MTVINVIIYWDITSFEKLNNIEKNNTNSSIANSIIMFKG